MASHVSPPLVRIESREALAEETGAGDMRLTHQSTIKRLDAPEAISGRRGAWDDGWGGAGAPTIDPADLRLREEAEPLRA